MLRHTFVAWNEPLNNHSWVICKLGKRSFLSLSCSCFSFPCRYTPYLFSHSTGGLRTVDRATSPRAARIWARGHGEGCHEGDDGGGAETRGGAEGERGNCSTTTREGEQLNLHGHLALLTPPSPDLIQFSDHSFVFCRFTRPSPSGITSPWCWRRARFLSHIPSLQTFVTVSASDPGLQACIKCPNLLNAYCAPFEGAFVFIFKFTVVVVLFFFFK